ncbi:MAG TPA: nuclease-related domain-containing protein, partial [Candidatus Binatia bacterium]
FFRVKRDVKALRLGRNGERDVGQKLEPLRKHGYQVFHDIIGDGFNIDHVLIGPAGIFTVQAGPLDA